MNKIQIGVDEAGRGPLVGSVVAAAVYLPPDYPIIGIKDSKKLTEKKRSRMYEQLVKDVPYAYYSVGPEIIEDINILQAALLAMKVSIDKLLYKMGLDYPDVEVLVDGNKPIPNCPALQHVSPGADDRYPAVSAASIIAKYVRDQEMYELDKLYPIYKFGKHKGYGTKEHLAAIKQYGPISQHRKSFKGVREYWVE